MSGSKLQEFDSSIALEIDNDKIPGFGVVQAGMVRRVIFTKLLASMKADPISALQTIAHMMELEKHRDAE